ncbi:MAG: class I SAM-dependent methyltransferase [Candidatus Poseidoniia archaeon]|nr:class I SAM-dependent methyltransferase [Candidatus Poseidoniia archaeon]
MKGLDPVIFDGKQIPFEDDAFDLAIVLTVLHHTSNPEEVLREAMRAVT